MNERQRDLFLYAWSHRRRPGRFAIGLRGLAIGALGGFVFALLLQGQGAHTPGVHAYETGRQLLSDLRLFALSIPAFASIGWIGADRIFMGQETQYQALLAAGARVPDHKPVMQLSDRGPALAVAIAFAVIAAFIIAQFVMYW
ncbi:MAG: hypothetical protein JNJ63_03840 [Hyphomonadaceae bacterium]|nr:hypothetical protein [Hyphomonadaceae bacterium]